MNFHAIDLKALALTLGGSFVISFWMLRLSEWSLVGNTLWKFILRDRGLSAKKIADQTLKLANAFKNHSPELPAYIDGCEIPLLKESIEMAREGILDEPSLLQVVQSRIHAAFLKNSQVGNKLRMLAPYPTALGVFGAIVSCYFIIQKLTGQTVPGETANFLSFGMSCLVYGTFFSYFILYPTSRLLNEWAKEQRVNGTLILVGTKLLVQKANPILVAEEMNSYLAKEDRVDWKSVK